MPDLLLLDEPLAGLGLTFSLPSAIFTEIPVL